MSITIDQMRDKLLTTDTVRQRLAVTEGLAPYAFATSESDGGTVPKFTLPDGWNVGMKDQEDTTVTEARVRIGEVDVPLTKGALLNATTFLGITRDYALKTPGPLVEAHVNWWFSHGARELKLLATPDCGVGFTRAAFDPLSSTRLLDTMLAAIEARYGGEVLFDYKFWHDMERTSVRAIVPGQSREIASARAEVARDDPWSVGVAFHSSLTGKSPLTLEGYAFSWWCTNGATHELANVENVYRRNRGSDLEDAYGWAETAIDEVLGGMEGELDKIAHLPEVDLGESEELVTTVRAMFDRYHVPVPSREQVLGNIEAGDDYTAYGLMNAITAAANVPGLTDRQVNTLLHAGGEIPRVMHDRCPRCKRI